MLVLSHRGLCHDARENTLAAFAAAVAAGVDGIETDVRLSSDGVAVLVHDPKIGRRKVSSMTHAEIARALGHHVPTLREALARFDVLWDVEIKSRDAVDATLHVLRRFAKTRRLFVTSFRRDVVRRIAAAAEFDCGRIVERAPLGVRRAPGVVVVWRFPIAIRRRVRRAHARGQLVFVYGPLTRRQHERCAAAGVDGIITDRPELARRLPAPPPSPPRGAGRRPHPSARRGRP
jgi:glycerophosphoryl diester phosphodiesterase